MKKKGKKEVQQLKKKGHLERRRQAKARRREKPDLARAAPSKLKKANLLIVCEGELTEPSYFRKFRLSSAQIKAVGEGYNTTTLVDRASALASEDIYDQVWCVFDKDDFSDQDFNSAVQKAEALGMGVAYSNQAFEYWIILHFEDHQGGAMHRNQYCDKINERLKPLDLDFDCDRKGVTDELFDLMQAENRQNQAIKRAQRIYEDLPHDSPAKEESSTTVFKLVQEIVKYQ